MNSFILRLCDLNVSRANEIVHKACGIVDFFSSEDDKNDFISRYNNMSATAGEDRAGYGDWQTPRQLAIGICRWHKSRYGTPDILVEPTCGLGAFVFAAIDCFPTLSELHAIEINSHYVTRLKFDLLANAINRPPCHYPDIYIYNANFFDFDLKNIFDKAIATNRQLAIIGNPPWVTNSRQGRYLSDNLPQKSNDYALNGIDAITGKSNFDISEYITLALLSAASACSGAISFLLKNSVIRSIISKQKIKPLNFGGAQQLCIDAAGEFGVSVEASCFSATLGVSPGETCQQLDFYTRSDINVFGWVGDRFVADIPRYRSCSAYDAGSSYTWRSGVKHDCADVLELRLVDGRLINGLGESVSVEDDWVYPLLKSSDIANNTLPGDRYILLPQRNCSDDTSSLRVHAPRTYEYLLAHADYFTKRKSSIYRNKDKFSIFGIGDYSFKPYKIVVSSLYKDIKFRLILPLDSKPTIVDDTCYQLGFDSIREAESILKALQSPEIKDLLGSITFPDAKRVVTKSLLMRLDVESICRDKGYYVP